ncbi:MAG: DUF1501 domain-containing protein [Planctomycetaceae bacterium]|nr:DUF1501 domain-containing protein [Planctomycetaceae bacterium]
MRNSSRRSFLRHASAGTAVLTFGGIAPKALQAAAMAQKSERILVVIELQGGNDGLNTVVPFADSAYQKLRPKLALKKDDLLTISDGLAFHGSLKGFADLLEAGQLAVIQGVGYENPNRSHFESMDIWHTCQRKEETRTDGWLGRFFEKEAAVAGTDPAALHLGADKQPFALMSRTVRTPSIRSLEQFRLQGADDADFRKAVQELADAKRGGGNDLLDFVQTSTSSAIAASERLSGAASKATTSVVWPTSPLADQLQTVARLIRSGLTTSVYYVTLNGFDTHSQQPDVHAALLRQLSDSVKALLDDVKEQGQSERVAVMCFSEFGRRVEENASDGTDHGTAGPMFIAGAASQIHSGLIGDHPKLNDLKDGDLKHHTDFRQVYAAVIEKWFQTPSSEILKGTWTPTPVFRS